MKTSDLVVLATSVVAQSTAFAPAPHGRPNTAFSSTSLMRAAPKRLQDNVDGPLYVNDKCINCAACSMFAPNSFARSETDRHHVVHKQPETEEDIEDARAALAACPVAAIRVESKAQRNHNNLEPMSPEHEQLSTQFAINAKVNGRPLPFPRRISPNVPDVYFVGHHNDRSFGAAPYLLKTNEFGWIMVDTPKYSKSAVTAVEKLTGIHGPNYLLLTHVDDTAGHNDWKEKYPNLQRVFHKGDLGRHNWVGDKSLESVEVLLDGTSTEESLQSFRLNGDTIDSMEDQEVVILHTPGHSPGSLTLWMRPTDNSPGVIFTGDTYSYTTRDHGRMTGFPRYGNDRSQQSKIVAKFLDLDWEVVAPGHGHVRDYTLVGNGSLSREPEMQPAIRELQKW